jgi:acyl-CoA thioesterase-1
MAIGLVALVVAAFTQAARATESAPANPAPSHTVLVMGDSLSAAYGLAESQGWVALIAARIADRKPGWQVVNASISGETTVGGAARIDRELAVNHPDVVVIELGANDAAHGWSLQQMRSNLTLMIAAAQVAHARVLLIGVHLTPDAAPAYAQEFERSYRGLSSKFRIPLLPSLLDPIDRSAFQADNGHPGASAQFKLRDLVWHSLEPLLN